MFGKIYNSQGNVLPYNFDIKLLNNVYDNTQITAFDLKESIGPLFIFYVESVQNINPTSFLGFYNIFSRLNYYNNEDVAVDINLNYPFSITNS